MQTEHVILLNAQGVPTGTLEKYAAHTAEFKYGGIMEKCVET